MAAIAAFSFQAAVVQAGELESMLGGDFQIGERVVHVPGFRKAFEMALPGDTFGTGELMIAPAKDVNVISSEIQRRITGVYLHQASGSRVYLDGKEFKAGDVVSYRKPVVTKDTAGNTVHSSVDGRLMIQTISDSKIVLKDEDDRSVDVLLHSRLSDNPVELDVVAGTGLVVGSQYVLTAVPIEKDGDTARPVTVFTGFGRFKAVGFLTDQATGLTLLKLVDGSVPLPPARLSEDLPVHQEGLTGYVFTTGVNDSKPSLMQIRARAGEPRADGWIVSRGRSPRGVVLFREDGTVAGITVRQTAGNTVQIATPKLFEKFREYIAEKGSATAPVADVMVAVAIPVNR